MTDSNDKRTDRPKSVPTTRQHLVKDEELRRANEFSRSLRSGERVPIQGGGYQRPAYKYNAGYGD